MTAVRVLFLFVIYMSCFGTHARNKECHVIGVASLDMCKEIHVGECTHFSMNYKFGKQRSPPQEDCSISITNACMDESEGRVVGQEKCVLHESKSCPSDKQYMVVLDPHGKILDNSNDISNRDEHHLGGTIIRKNENMAPYYIVCVNDENSCASRFKDGEISWEKGVQDRTWTAEASPPGPDEYYSIWWNDPLLTNQAFAFGVGVFISAAIVFFIRNGDSTNRGNSKRTEESSKKHM